MMNADQVRPCRRCGGPGVYNVEKDAWDIEHVWLRCSKCQCYVIADTVDDAVKKWNAGEVHHAIL